MDPLTDSDPRVLGPIALLGRLGAGGMGQVYLGATEEGDRVAVKVLKAELAERADVHKRFVREVMAMGMVQGPATAALIASSQPDEKPLWLAME